VYAGRNVDGTVNVMAINKTEKTIDARVALSGLANAVTVSSDVLSAQSLEATGVSYNGSASPAVDFSDVPAKSLGSATGTFEYTFAPFSITVLRFKP
jgi:alpha-L-arabinofuranosidase